jgi:polyhydroxybutyrate depolymerase
MVATLAWIGGAFLAPPSASPERPTKGCAEWSSGHRFTTTLSLDGVRRSALVNVPARDATGSPRPLVLTFHGAGGNAQAIESATGMTDLGNRAGFITVYPNSVGRFWNVTGKNPRTGDDVSFVNSLLDRLEDTLCVDDARIYATGVSNGGSFVARIGCELSGRIAAIAPVAGGYGVQPACRPSRPVSVLEIHGTNDRTVPYDHDGPSGEKGVWPFLAQWNGWDGCPRTPPVWRRLAPRALWVAKASCAGGSTVAHIKLLGGPHAWPTTKPAEDEGVPFSARGAVWQFFSTRSVLPSRGRRSARGSVDKGS